MSARELSSLEGKYEILRKLREGGMGAVYLVRHRLLRELRVVKRLRPQHASDDRIQQRFLREAKIAIQLRHPNIAQIYDYSLDDDGTAYVVMEYLDGVDLEEVVRTGGRLDLGLTLEVGCQALEALTFLHGEGFIHRDVSPDNLMLLKNGSGGPLVKLIDLGIAKRLGTDTGGLTRTGTFLGKVKYSAPEQFAGKGGAVELDHRCDIYSFAVLLYELMTGQLPFAGEDLGQLVAGHLFEEPKAFAITDPDGRVPDTLREATLAALAKKPEERIQTCSELRGILGVVAREHPVAHGELDRVIAAAGSVSEMPSVEPGSTQERLNRHFDARSESAEGDAASAPTLVTPAGGRPALPGLETQPLTLPAEPSKGASPQPKPPEGRLEGVLAAGSVEEALAALGADALAERNKSQAASSAPPRKPSSSDPLVGEAVTAISNAIAAGELDQARAMLDFARLRYGRLVEFDRLEAHL